MLAYLANTLIFVIVGVIVAQYINYFNGADLVYLLILYVGIIVIRAISVFTFFPLMNRFGIEMTWRHMLVMTWGGLRGAVGLTLALFLNSYAKLLTPSGQSKLIPTTTVVTTMNTTLNDSLTTTAAPRATDFQQIFLKILMHTGGIVILTLFINASTTEAVLKQLGMLEVSAAERATMMNAVHKIQNSVRRSIAILKSDRFLADSRWRMVEEMTEVEYPYKHLQGAPPAQQTSYPAIHIAHSDDLAFKDLFEEARLRMIKALKMSYLKQYSHGLIQDQEARILIAAADKAADYPGEFINVEDVRKAWVVTGVFPYIKQRLEYWMYGRKITQLIPPRNRHRRKVFRLITNEQFDLFIQLIVLLNIIPIGFDLAHDDTWESAEEWLFALEVTNYVFLSIYTVELILRFIGLGWTQFRKNRWIQFDLIILFIAFGELIAAKLVVAEAGSGAGTLVKTVRTTKFIKAGKILRGLRATRLLRLTKTVLPRTVDFINRLINRKLHVGYNVGKGFVTAEEEVNKLFGSICNNEKIQQKLLTASEKNRLTVIKEMGLLQRDHPGIATSVKTRNAIRTLLNHIKDSIQQLFSGGVLDETELRLLEQNIEIKLKQLVNFPSFLAPAAATDIVGNIVWVKDDPLLFDYILKNAEYKDFDYEDVIIDNDEELDGLHVILKGMVKMVRSFQDQPGGMYGKRLRKASVMSRKMTPGLSMDKDTSDYSSDDLMMEKDYLGVGTIFGDLALLTGGFKRCTVTCETVVQTMFLSVRCLEEAFLDFPYLRRTLWKVAAIRLATPLYLDQFEYQGIGLEQVHLHLAQGYIVELDEAQPTFSFTAGIQEAALVFGSLVVMTTDEIIEAPYLLLPELEEVNAHWCPFAILLVIPKETTNVDVVPSLRSIPSRRGIVSLAGRSKSRGSPAESSPTASRKVPVLEVHNEEGNVKVFK